MGADDGAEIIELLKKAYDILNGWGKGRTQLILSTGPFSLEVEGMLHEIRGDDRDFLDRNFIFPSASGEITAIVLLIPPIKPLVRPSGDIALQFGPDDNERFTLRPVRRPKPEPAALAEVTAQLNAWVSQKTKLTVHFDFMFASFGCLSEIESVNGLTECEGNHTYIAIPSISSQVSLQKVDDLTIVRLGSKNGRYDFSIIESHSDIVGPMGLMISKMVHLESPAPFVPVGMRQTGMMMGSEKQYQLDG